MNWLEEAKKEIENSSPQSSIYVGCDSICFKDKKGIWQARYSTVIVIHKDSRHGCTIKHNNVIMRDFGNIRERLMNEVGFAIEAANEILESVGNRFLSIHLDLNPDPRHKSNVVIKEAVGYVKGMFPNIDVQVKPNGWCASAAADHSVRNF